MKYLCALLFVCMTISCFATTTLPALAGNDPTPKQHIKASFIGGETAFDNYLKDQLKYPNCARLKGIEGTVSVTFYVLENGSIKYPRVVQGIDDKCDQYVLAFLQNMPNWNPATVGGKKVPSKFHLDLDFSLGL